jgi:hypothetical protein
VTAPQPMRNPTTHNALLNKRWIRGVTKKTKL